MSQNYNRKLEAQDDTIRTLNQRMDQSEILRNPELENILTRENESLKNECVVLREKVSSLSRELDIASKSRGDAEMANALESENRRLRNDLVDKEREFSRQLDQMRSLITEKDTVASK